MTIGDQVQLVTENQSVYIPLGEVHRMENPGKVPMILIEVQTGSYLGEDDIIRYEDIVLSWVSWVSFWLVTRNRSVLYLWTFN